MFEALETSLTLDAGDFIRGARRAAAASDELGDEVSEAGTKAARASAGFAALGVSTNGLSFSLGLLTSVGTSTLTVLGGLALAAGAVVVALAPIAIGAAAIAAAFGAIVSTGILAWGKGFQTALKNVRKQIVPLVKEFGTRFVPFLKETIRMLPGLAKSIFTAIGPMDRFLGALRQLRNVAFTILPKLIGWFVDLGRWALPIVMRLATGLLQNLLPALRKITRTGKNTATGFSRLKGAAISFWNGLKPVVRALGPLINELVRLGGIIAFVALKLGGKLLPLLAPLLTGITRVLRAVTTFAMALGGVQMASKNLSPQLRKLKTEALILWKNLQPVIRTLMDIGRRVIPFVRGLLTLLAQTLVDLGVVVLNVMNGDFREAKKIFMRALKRISAFATKWGRRLITWLKTTLVPALLTGLKQFGRWALKTVKRALRDIAHWLRHDAARDLATAAVAAGNAAAKALKRAFNAVLPDSISIPTITLGRGVPGPDHTVGGGSIKIPQLASGGRIRETGLFLGHAGEHVLTAAEVNKGAPAPGASTERGPEQIIIQLDGEATTDVLREEAVGVFEDKIDAVRRKQQRRRGSF